VAGAERTGGPAIPDLQCAVDRGRARVAVGTGQDGTTVRSQRAVAGDVVGENGVGEDQQGRVVDDVSGGGPVVGLNPQRTGIDGGRAAIADGAGQRQFTGSVFVQSSGAGNVAVDGDGIGPVDGEHRVVDDVSQSDIANSAATAEIQHARADGG